MSQSSRSLAPLLAALVALGTPAAAHAAHPGANGVIALSGPELDGAGNQVHLVAADGTGSRRITEDMFLGRPRWSPDGTRLAIERPGMGAPVWAPASAFAADAIAPDEYVAFFDDANRFDAWGLPAWAPDGKTVAAAHAGGLAAQQEPGLYVVEADGERTRLAAGTGDEVAWSPAGDRIAQAGCAADDATHCGIWVTDAETGNSSLVATGEGGFSAHSPDWSPDGSRLVFEIGTPRGTGLGIFTVAAAGGAKTRVRTSGWTPAFSPDGTRIAYAQGDGLYTMTAAGGDARRAFAGYAADPDWQPLPAEDEEGGVTDNVVGDGEAPGDDEAAAAPAPTGPGASETSSTRLTLVSKSLRVDGRGRVAVKLTCAGAAACSGTLALRTSARTLARARYALEAGTTATVTLSLSRSARRALPRTSSAALTGAGLAARVRLARA